jgi:predicted HNH restriction endonuclease
MFVNKTNHLLTFRKENRMDITRKGWNCDACEKEFFEGQYGYSQRYKVIIQHHSNTIDGNNTDLKDVCLGCVEKMIGVLDINQSSLLFGN